MVAQGETAQPKMKLRKPKHPIQKKELFFAFFLSLIFTLGIFPAAFLMVLGINAILLRELVPDPFYFITDVSAVAAAEARAETLKVVAFVILILLILLIITGFLIHKFKLSLTSSLISMLPVFSSFGISMTWLYGISASMMLWLPIIETCPEILGLGDAVFAPFFIPLLDSWNSIDPRWYSDDYHAIATYYGILIVLINVVGMFLLVFSITTWLYGKTHGHELIDFWIYKYSRHPQYLGFLLMSYGMVFFFGFQPFHYIFSYRIPTPTTYIPAPTIFWLLSALSIIAMALREENHLLTQNNQEYVNWRTHTPFLIPLPKLLSGQIRAPVKLLLKKDWPENDKEILFVLSIYGLFLILCSLPIIGLYYP